MAVLGDDLGKLKCETESSFLHESGFREASLVDYQFCMANYFHSSPFYPFYSCFTKCQQYNQMLNINPAIKTYQNHLCYTMYLSNTFIQ